MPRALSTAPKAINRSSERVRAECRDLSDEKPLARIRIPNRPPRPQERRGTAPSRLPGSALALERRPGPTPSYMAGTEPADCYLYFDKVTILIGQRLSAEDRAMLRSHCDHLDVRRNGEWLGGRNGYKQIAIYPHVERVQATRPTSAFIDYFAARDDAQLAHVEIASDITFDNESDKYRLLQFFERHLIQPRQNKRRQFVLFDNGGISTGSKRKGGHYFTGYLSKECRIDGIADCWHFEARYKGRAALARIGLHHPCDFASGFLKQYWKHWEDQGHLIDIDLERLGRYHRNKISRERRQHTQPQSFHGYPSEYHWLGSKLFRIHGIDDQGHISVQTFIRNYGRGPYLIKLDYLSALGFA